eukprot:CAMPEP_0113939400 /NCGR_PEP_ID=MMETSP1339-20121228/5721_1 /TAXON_ID=94617 /ORGANISM="Fibrocapsa japonica" /LENGTH=543 /DNA_ID=CAMNT_0000942899 /DNA_START=75 /DNA_END=1706 /DNA_ORIENTATION=+ /assembly_acc=CAM_ASM_000762
MISSSSLLFFLLVLPSCQPAFIRRTTTESSEASCLGGSDFTITYDGTCSYDGFVDAIQSQLNELADPCSHDAATEIQYLFGVSNIQAMKEHIAELCTGALQYFPFEEIMAEGKQFDTEYYNGNTWLNNERQTIDENGFYYHVLQSDAHRIKQVYHGKAQTTGIDWPEYIPNFEECKLRAAMCCFVQDRQANDNNGNCDTPYDSGCTDADPADNTDICFVDMSRAPQSSRVSHGFAIFENGGEDFSHCHGLAWGHDPSEAEARYKANSLFYVSMYDHLYTRGYVSNVPGAPMCSCIEHMPVVTRSDCTEIDAKESLEINYSASTGELGVNILSVEIDFNACQGENNQNNDLSAYYQRLVNEGRASQEEKEIIDSMLVHDCKDPIADFIESQWLAPKADIVITNFASSRRIFAQANKNGENGVGAGFSGTIYQDNYWQFKQVSCGDMADVGEKCFYLQNAKSQRRLYAQADKVGEDGVGADDGDTIYADQKWLFQKEDCGSEECYLIVNAYSGRRLYALPDFNWQAAFGAVDPSSPIEDTQKWIF